MSLAQDRKLGHYLLEHEIGAGGLGKVFRAIDTKNGNVVAVKILHEKYQKSSKFLGIFHRELLVISRLRHKHIVSFIDANYDPPKCFIVTEYVDGWSLYKLLKQVSPLPPLVALAICFDILQGIDYLHLHDMIHSDLSSPNVLISKNGKVLVTDFGLACDGAIENYKNYLVGTPGFYSPEHVTDHSLQASSDIYCVGLLLFEMITGQKAVVASKDSGKVVASMKSIDFKQISLSDKKLEALVRSLLKKTLRFQQSFRFRNAEDVLVKIYKILRQYNIRYARHAIHQFLGDQGLSIPISDNRRQEIYHSSDSRPLK